MNHLNTSKIRQKANFRVDFFSKQKGYFMSKSLKENLLVGLVGSTVAKMGHN